MEHLHLLLLPLFYLCIDEKKGLQIYILVMLSTWINILFGTFVSVSLWIPICLVLCGYLFLGSRIESLFARGGFRVSMYAGAILSLIMIVYLPNRETLIPGAVMLGICTGYCLNKRYIGFKTADVRGRTGIVKFMMLAVRYLLGIAGMLLIYFAVGKIIPQDSENWKLYNFIHIALTGFWVSAGAPWVFMKIRLAGTSAGSAPESSERKEQ